MKRNRLPTISLFALAVLCAAGLSASVQAGEDIPKEHLDFFEMKVRPLLVAKCQKCHGDNQQKGQLRLDSLAAIKAGGENGPAVVVGNPKESLLIQAVRYEGLEMPPSGRLTEDEVTVLADWVKLGAPWPAEKDPDLTVRSRNRQVTDEDRAWWSYQPIRRPAVPTVADDNWSRNAIDRFILARLREEGVAPSAPASAAAITRRLKQDLLGLPVSDQDREALEKADPAHADEAYEQLVERWLADPRYGERWARHWLDVVRFAESDGYKQDSFRPTAWRYRDYVIRAFNTDKPYDQFIREQLAGDEIVPATEDSMVATGFLRAGIYEYNQRDVRTQWDNILNEMTDVTAEVFLGLSMSCARCHDHKYDPLLQKDYFSLRSAFAAIAFRDDAPATNIAEVRSHQERMAAWEEKTAALRAEMDVIENVEREKASQGPVDKFPDEIRAIFAKPESFRSPYEQQIAALAWRQVEEELRKLDFAKVLKGENKERWEKAREQLKELEAAKPAPLPTTLAITDIGPTAPPTHIPGKANSEDFVPAAPAVLPGGAFPVSHALASTGTTGRRTALARWISHPDNPLTARVLVNRLWHYHFGRGLAATTSDLGHLGTPPSHPELLDWLAAELISSGWSVKHVQRLIVTSATFRQAAHGAVAQESLAKDPSNRWFGRFSIRRLDAEQIRDAMLFVTRELQPHSGGSSVDPTTPRRSIYTKLLRNKFDPLLEEFDAPENTFPTSVRYATVTPNQSLLLLNGPWVLQRAKTLAAACSKEKTVDGQIEQAFRRVLGRPPSAAEKDAAIAYFYRQSTEGEKKDAPVAETLADFCHVLLSSNEFLYVD